MNVWAHLPTCHIGILAQIIADLEGRYLRIQCPLCNEGHVEVNTDDLYECRSCRAVFTRLDQGKNLPTFQLQHPFNDEPFPVQLLRRKGKGRFVVDRELSKARREQQKYYRSAPYRKLLRQSGTR
jgi:hypothetical protein